jgi:hypothetical protein
MTVLHNNGVDPVPQSRHPYGSYRLPIETRAALAVGLIENAGWSLKDAAASLCVNRTYLMLARSLADADRHRLACSELKLAQVHRDYCQRLAGRRAQREQTKRAAVEATHAQLEQSGRARRFGSGSAAVLSDSVIETIVRDVGVDRIWRAVDRLTQPELPLVAAE